MIFKHFENGKMSFNQVKRQVLNFIKNISIIKISILYYIIHNEVL